MFIGIIYALLACLVWGLIYVIPSLLLGYNAIEITIMRYVFYGGLSSIILLFNIKKIFKKYPLSLWINAFMLALFGHVFFYLGTVIGLRLASPPVTILIVGGLVPIVVAFYGNWELREVRFSCLILPAIGIALGMLLVNFSEIDWSFKTESPKEYAIGLTAAFLALLFWSWYAVKNGRILKENPNISHGVWTTIIGVGTLFWVTLFLGVLMIGWGKELDWPRYLKPSQSLYYFLLGTFFLGTVCSWGGVYFWNKACSRLPMSIAGPMVIFETLFGLTAVYLVQGRIPSMIELTGALIMLAGIVYILLMLRKNRLEG